VRSSKKYDYIVIGGGIVGLSTALKLQEANKKILILEKKVVLVYTNQTQFWRSSFRDLLQT